MVVQRVEDMPTKFLKFPHCRPRSRPPLPNQLGIPYPILDLIALVMLYVLLI